MKALTKRVKIIIGIVLGAVLICVVLFLTLFSGSDRIVNAPAPPREVTLRPLPPPIPSTLAVKAELPIQDVKPLVESALQDYLHKPIQRKDGSIESSIQLNPGPMLMTRMPDDTISIQMPFQFSGWAEVSKTVFRKVIRKREDFDGAAAATLNLRFMFNPDWRITAQSSLDISIQRADIKIVGITISIRSLLTKLVEDKVVPKLEELIVTHITRVNLKSRVAGLWEKLHEPIVIRDEPPIVLVIQPLEILTQQLSGDVDTLSIHLGIKTHIHVRIGETVEAAPIPPLPDLRFVDSLESGYHIIAPVEVAYTAIQQLAKPYVEKTHKLKGIETQVGNLTLYGSGTQLVAGVTFGMPTFNAKGKLYLLGTPVYNATEMTVAVTEFDYSLTTQSLLLSIAEDVGEGFFPDLRTTVEEKLVFPLEQQLTQLHETLSGAIEKRKLGSYVILRGTVDTVAPEALYLTQNGLQVWFRLEGRLAAEVNLHPLK